MGAQPDLFGVAGGAGPVLPDGFQYAPDVITVDMERDLLARMEALPFREFDFHGYKGKRRVVSFGWRYDFSARRLIEADPMPDFLMPAREAAAAFAGMSAGDIRHALVTEYQPGAAIGWHKDKDVFDEIVGVSLRASCTFRLRRETPNGWERVNIEAAPRSAYLLSGIARTQWEHSIPPVAALRYSITFRTLRERQRPPAQRER